MCSAESEEAELVEAVGGGVISMFVGGDESSGGAGVTETGMALATPSQEAVPNQVELAMGGLVASLTISETFPTAFATSSADSTGSGGVESFCRLTAVVPEALSPSFSIVDRSTSFLSSFGLLSLGGVTIRSFSLPLSSLVLSDTLRALLSFPLTTVRTERKLVESLPPSPELLVSILRSESVARRLLELAREDVAMLRFRVDVFDPAKIESGPKETVGAAGRDGVALQLIARRQSASKASTFAFPAISRVSDSGTHQIQRCGSFSAQLAAFETD